MKKIFLTCLIFSVIDVICALIYIPLAFSGTVKSGWFEYFILASFLALAWLPYLILRLTKIKLNHFTVIYFLTFCTASMLAGSLWKVYDALFFYDIIIHTLSGPLCVLFAYELFINSSQIKVSPFWIFILTFSFAMMVGGVWEIFEFSCDGIFGLNAQRYLGYSGRAALLDTMIDLICDFLGSILGGILCLILHKKAKKNKIQPQI